MSPLNKISVEVLQLSLKPRFPVAETLYYIVSCSLYSPPRSPRYQKGYLSCVDVVPFHYFMIHTCINGGNLLFQFSNMMMIMMQVGKLSSPLSSFLLKHLKLPLLMAWCLFCIMPSTSVNLYDHYIIPNERWLMSHWISRPKQLCR